MPCVPSLFSSRLAPHVDLFNSLNWLAWPVSFFFELFSSGLLALIVKFSGSFHQTRPSQLPAVPLPSHNPLRQNARLCAASSKDKSPANWTEELEYSSLNLQSNDISFGTREGPIPTHLLSLSQRLKVLRHSSVFKTFTPPRRPYSRAHPCVASLSLCSCSNKEASLLFFNLQSDRQLALAAG